MLLYHFNLYAAAYPYENFPHLNQSTLNLQETENLDLKEVVIFTNKKNEPKLCVPMKIVKKHFHIISEMLDKDTAQNTEILEELPPSIKEKYQLDSTAKGQIIPITTKNIDLNFIEKIWPELIKWIQGLEFIEDKEKFFETLEELFEKVHDQGAFSLTDRIQIYNFFTFIDFKFEPSEKNSKFKLNLKTILKDLKIHISAANLDEFKTLIPKYDFSMYNLEFEDYESFEKLANYWHELEIGKELTLSITGDFGDDEVIALSEKISLFKNITGLSVAGKFKDNGAIALSEEILMLKEIEKLTIQGEFGNKGITALAQAVSTLTDLRELTIKGGFGADDSFQYRYTLHQTTPRWAQDLAVAISHLKDLNELTLYGQLNDSIVSVLANGISHLESLTKCAIYGEFSDRGLSDLLNILSQKATLEKLALKGSFHNYGMHTIAQALRQLTGLTSLSIYGIGNIRLEENGIKDLGEAISHLNNLRDLIIHGKELKEDRHQVQEDDLPEAAVMWLANNHPISLTASQNIKYTRRLFG